MKVPSITAFAEALAAGSSSFRTLRSFSAVCAPEGAGISRTSLFAEAVIMMDSRRWLLCSPLCSESLERVREAAHILCHADSAAFPEYRILPDEMSFTDSAGMESRCGLVLTSLPDGVPLDTAVHYSDTARLLSALELLRAEFLRAGVVHRNLKPSNLIWGDDGRMYPVRCHYMRRALSREETEAEFAAAERYIRSFPVIVSGEEVAPQPYVSALEKLYDKVFPLHDMMRRVVRGERYGYVDDCGRTVIEPCFTSAGDFSENRAVVSTADGAGIIDRTGRYVVEPVYDIADFDPDRGGYVACRDGVWHVFDYMGRLSARGSYAELFGSLHGVNPPATAKSATA